MLKALKPFAGIAIAAAAPQVKRRYAAPEPPLIR